jgi:hypothetical protein
MSVAKALALKANANSIALKASEDNYNAQALYELLAYGKSNGVCHYF